MAVKEIGNRRKIVARKSHICNWCGCAIDVGETYQAQTLVDEGEIYRWKNHIKCDELVTELDMEGDDGITAADFYEYISDAYKELLRKTNAESFTHNNFVIPSFKDQVDAVYNEYIINKK